MKITILYGGKSGEHEVSLVSAASVARNIDLSKHTVDLIGITKEGKLQEEKIFIDSGYEIKWTEPKYNLKEEKLRIEKASKAINQREMINYLFGDLRC